MKLDDLIDRIDYLLGDEDTYSRGLLLIQYNKMKYEVLYNNNQIFDIPNNPSKEIECYTYNRNTISEALQSIQENYKFEVSTRGCKKDILLDEIRKL